MNLSIGNIIMGLIGLAIGIYLIVKAYYLNHHVMFLDWAEKKWGPGSGTTTYRLIGLGLCFFSLFVIVGWIDLFGAAYEGSSQRNNTGSSQIQTVPSGNTRNRIVE
jgi:hypothetical protein